MRFVIEYFVVSFTPLNKFFKLLPHNMSKIDIANHTLNLYLKINLKGPANYCLSFFFFLLLKLSNQPYATESMFQKVLIRIFADTHSPE